MDNTLDPVPDWWVAAVRDDIALEWWERRDIIRWVLRRYPKYRRKGWSDQQFWAKCAEWIECNFCRCIAKPDHLIAMWERIRRERIKHYPDDEDVFFDEDEYGPNLVHMKQWEDYMDSWMALPENANRCLDPDSVDGAGTLSDQRGQKRAEKDARRRKRKRTEEDESGSLPSSPLAGKKSRTEKDKASEAEGPSMKQLDKLSRDLTATMDIFGENMTTMTRKVEEPLHQIKKAVAKLNRMQLVFDKMQDNMSRLGDDLATEQNKIYQAVTQMGTQMCLLGSQMSETVETLGEMKGKVTDS
jgi:hypothetical protein